MDLKAELGKLVPTESFPFTPKLLVTSFKGKSNKESEEEFAQRFEQLFALREKVNKRNKLDLDQDEVELKRATNEYTFKPNREKPSMKSKRPQPL